MFKSLGFKSVLVLYSIFFLVSGSQRVIAQESSSLSVERLPLEFISEEQNNSVTSYRFECLGKYQLRHLYDTFKEAFLSQGWIADKEKVSDFESLCSCELSANVDDINTKIDGEFHKNEAYAKISLITCCGDESDISIKISGVKLEDVIGDFRDKAYKGNKIYVRGEAIVPHESIDQSVGIDFYCGFFGDTFNGDDSIRINPNVKFEHRLEHIVKSDIKKNVAALMFFSGCARVVRMVTIENKPFVDLGKFEFKPLAKSNDVGMVTGVICQKISKADSFKHGYVGKKAKIKLERVQWPGEVRGLETAQQMAKIAIEVQKQSIDKLRKRIETLKQRKAPVDFIQQYEEALKEQERHLEERYQKENDFNAKIEKSKNFEVESNDDGIYTIQLVPGAYVAYNKDGEEMLAQKFTTVAWGHVYVEAGNVALLNVMDKE
ncbi:MAG: hypothetical protein KBA46_07235 [Candidatus Omnitrophica bacterium]|nr:hypothetical protein [Candidatus Omnitrophota bacterium]